MLEIRASRLDGDEPVASLRWSTDSDRGLGLGWLASSLVLRLLVDYAVNGQAGGFLEVFAGGRNL